MIMGQMKSRLSWFCHPEAHWGASTPHLRAGFVGETAGVRGQLEEMSNGKAVRDQDLLPVAQADSPCLQSPTFSSTSVFHQWGWVTCTACCDVENHPLVL
jgi:hypothetical protein